LASPPAAGGGGAKGIADLLVLQQRLRSCHTHAELALLVVNESRLLLPYDVALIWFERPLEAVSGLAEPVRNATFTRWANELPTLLAGEKEQSAQLLGEENLPAPLNEEWGDYLPPRGLWLPLWPAGSERQAGALLLVRHREWSEGEQPGTGPVRSPMHCRHSTGSVRRVAAGRHFAGRCSGAFSCCCWPLSGCRCR
jgi:hypothetical protein